jgi:hypothetical protein
MHFEIVDDVAQVETIAAADAFGSLSRLQKYRRGDSASSRYGTNPGPRWSDSKGGIALV